MLDIMMGIGVLSMQFEWDEDKANKNLSKHAVSFDEAKTAFDDPLYIDFYDPDHSDSEHQYIRIGYSEKRRLLVISYIERDPIIRLISARAATKKEQKAYEEG